ncbi:MAG TPA: RNA polymerase sigma factor [Ktedonobacteraceae bacterium]|nr:RNA polymerase sigma factor [Ktedonobacteraceae bacterium]
METIPAAQAVEALIHAYGTLVFQTIYGFTGDWHESQDLTQETFLQALRAIDAARASSGTHFHAKAWLFRIATNLVLMQRRRQARIRVLPFSSLQEGQDETEVDCPGAHAAPVQPTGYATAPTGDPADLVAERDAIRRTMGLLPESLRLCLLLSVVGGFSAPQMARILHLREAAVRQRLARARKRFRALYRQESGEAVTGDRPAGQPATSTIAAAPRQQMEQDQVLVPSSLPSLVLAYP